MPDAFNDWFVSALDAARWPITIAYLLCLLLLAAFGVHRYWLTFLFCRHGGRTLLDPHRQAEPALADQDLPAVTVQLPMFNEGEVGRRVIDAVAAFDYPRHLLQVQVLDDSTDGSEAVAAQAVARHAADGLNIQLHHRTDRTGYKAGALAEATPHAQAELIAIFDADFVPAADFLRCMVPAFRDPQLGVVQARWTHLNRGHSLLTRAQAVFIDAHFIIEHTARNRHGAWMHFNGTAGIWRKRCIEEAGGWSHGTLTEDLDLSYRAQLRGWRFRYLPQVFCPAELPPEMNAFKSQQHRWTKGTVQVALKLMRRIWASRQPLRVKVEASAHLLNPLAYPVALLFTLLYPIALYLHLNEHLGPGRIGFLVGLFILTLGTVSAGVFFAVAQRALGRSGLRTLLFMPVLMAVAVGLAVSNTLAVLEALTGRVSGFVRTPKYGSGTKRQRPKLSAAKLRVVGVELTLGLAMAGSAVAALAAGTSGVAVPFLTVFAAGYLYIGLASLRDAYLPPRRSAKPAGTAAAPGPVHAPPAPATRRPSGSTACRPTAPLATVDTASAL